MLETSCGSPCYAAPEMVNGGQYDCVKTDIWAMGVTLYAMAAGCLPFEH
jgi:serine/threonine protein kinase